MDLKEWAEVFRRDIDDLLDSPGDDFVKFEKMYRAIQQIKRDEFVKLVTDFFGGHDTDYAEGCWNQFCLSPIGYIYSRSPLEQGEMLFKFAKEKIDSKDIGKRCFSTNRQSYRRYKKIK